MRVTPISKLFFLAVFALLSPISGHAQVSSCFVPMDEMKSAPSSDLIQNGASADSGLLLEQIKNGFDSSTLEPQKSKVYLGEEQKLIQFADMTYPSEQDTLDFSKEIGSSSGLLFTRVTLSSNPDLAYQLNFSLDVHPALARSALLRKLGYAFTSPKYYPKITVNFPSLTVRDGFLEHLASVVGDQPSYRMVLGGKEEIAKNNLKLTFQDVVIEPAVMEVPQMHWGIFRQDKTIDTLQGRRSLRALLVPLTLLNIPQSANMYSFEAVKVDRESISFNRVNAKLFSDQTSLGDLKWIAGKIAKLTRSDWKAILQAAHYPTDIEALLLERTIGRMNQMLGVIGINNFTPLPYNEYLTYGNVTNGKATQQYYDGYAQRFTYGDPANPLRASELGRFFGIETVSGALQDLFQKVNQYFQVITPAKYIQAHQEKSLAQFFDHFQKYPDVPYVHPLEIWGGPVANGGVNASRSIVTGTYYGSDSKIQLVDSVSANAAIGGFFGVSGIKGLPLALAPQLQYSRNYVHVRPLTDIKTAWKDSWKNLLVPAFMNNLSKTLLGAEGEKTDKAIEEFLTQMKEGEMFIITDGLAGGLSAQANIPLGAMLGFLGPYSGIGAGLNVGDQYAILSRTTIVRTKEGTQIYLSRIHSGAFETGLDATFFIKLLSLTNTFSHGSAHTEAFVIPETLKTPELQKSYQQGMSLLLRKNNASEIEEHFNAFSINHQNSGNKLKFAFGPWNWTQRENFHSLQITPPDSVDGKFKGEDYIRTAIQGQITRISGSNFYGFFSSVLKNFVPLFNLGGGVVGDDPSSSFLGKSKSFTVSTEIETTEGRPNRTFTKLSQSHAGWSINKKRFLRIISQIKDQIGIYNPQGGLIDPSEFAQTTKVQAYTILWEIYIYEHGLDRIFNLLDTSVTDTKRTQEQLIDIMGKPAYLEFCNSKMLEPKLASGPYSEDEIPEGSLIESSRGQTTFVGCIAPWMATVYNLRQTLSQYPEVFQKDVRSEDETKEKIKWINRAMLSISRDLDLEKMITWVGKENAFFRVRVSGFRTHDERALDENFNSNYFSSSIGQVDRDVVNGTFSDIETTSKLSSHEIEARYLSDGY